MIFWFARQIGNAVKKKIIVLGSGGFLGSSLARSLCCKDVELYLVSRGLGSYAGISNVTQLSNSDFLEHPSCLHGADMLINCAFPRTEDPESLSSGLGFLAEMMEAAASLSISHFVDVSSQSVYSQYRLEPADEHSEIALESKYSVAKYATELLFDSYFGRENTTHVRLASLIGPSFNQRLPNRLAANALDEGILRISEAGNRYGYLHVADAVSGLSKILLEKDSPRQNVYVLGADGSCTISQQATWIQEVLKWQYGHEVKLIGKDLETGKKPLNTELNSELFKEEFSWECSYTIEAAIKDIALNLMRHRSK